jgi:hypothetical protein
MHAEHPTLNLGHYVDCGRVSVVHTTNKVQNNDDLEAMSFRYDLNQILEYDTCTNTMYERLKRILSWQNRHRKSGSQLEKRDIGAPHTGSVTCTCVHTLRTGECAAVGGESRHSKCQRTIRRRDHSQVVLQRQTHIAADDGRRKRTESCYTTQLDTCRP